MSKKVSFLAILGHSHKNFDFPTGEKIQFTPGVSVLSFHAKYAHLTVHW